MVSPNSSLEEKFIMSEIDPHKERDAANIDIPRTYLNKDTEKDVIIVVKG